MDATLWPRAASVVMVTEHLIEVSDWEYIETISERERERVVCEVNEGGDGRKGRHRPLTRSRLLLSPIIVRMCRLGHLS